MVSDNYVVRRGQVVDCGLRGSRYQSTMPQVHLLSSWDPILLPNLRRIADTSENSHHSQAVQVITYIHVNLGQAVNMSCVIEKQAMATNGKTKTPITMVISARVPVANSSCDDVVKSLFTLEYSYYHG